MDLEFHFDPKIHKYIKKQLKNNVHATSANSVEESWCCPLVVALLRLSIHHFKLLTLCVHLLVV